MWTLARVKTDLDDFLGPKTTPNIRIINQKCSREKTNMPSVVWGQNLSMGEADFNQFIRQRNQLVVAANNFLREQNLSPLPQSTLSKDMKEQLKLVHKVIDLVDHPKRRIFVTLLRYKADNPDTSYAQVRLFESKTEQEKFQAICVCQL